MLSSQNSFLSSPRLMEGQLAVEVVDGVLGEGAVAAVDAPHDLVHHAAQPLRGQGNDRS